MTLTREQVEQKLTDLIDMAADGHKCLIVKDEVMAHDAALRQQLEASKQGKCLKCNMGPMRESCAYPEACEHPGRELASAYNQALLELAAVRKELTMVCEKMKAYGMQQSSLSGMLWCYPHFTQQECEQVAKALNLLHMDSK